MEEEYLKTLKEKLCVELHTLADSEVTTRSLDVIDKLTHSLKSIEAILSMKEK